MKYWLMSNALQALGLAMKPWPEMLLAIMTESLNSEDIFIVL